MRPYPLYIFDLDGTLYRGNEALPGAVETVRALLDRGAQVRYLTNNSSRTVEDQAAKLEALGLPATPELVVTSATGTARYAAAQRIPSAYVIGEDGLRSALAASGIQVDPDRAPDAVIVGICWSFDYSMVNQAMQHIRAGARFIATNTDATYPLEQGRLVPGAGVVVGAVQIASGVEPVVIGKPNPYLVELILQDTGVPAAEALVVGDRYETDILAGRNAGCDTMLVLTGVTGAAPDGVASVHSLTELL
jgi:4-nitrophenyl phosphatase